MTKKIRPTRARTPQGVLRAAARVIRKVGWYQGHYVGPYGNVCALGAINMALGYDPASVPTARLAHAAKALIMRRLSDDDEFSVAAWNDSHARKVEDVLRVMESKAVPS